MELDSIRAALERLDAQGSPAVTRFDNGGALVGRVAVLPSAFNPPTMAHLALLELANVGGNGRTALAMLTTRNVAKGVYGASLAHRVGMLLEVGRARPGLAVVAANAARLVDQGRALRDGFAGVGFDFIVGYDTLVRLFDPLYYDDMERDLTEFFAEHRVVATNRGSTPTGEVLRFLARPETAPFAGRIEVREIEPYAGSLSSTASRERLAQGVTDDSLPPEVSRYIAAHSPYH